MFLMWVSHKHPEIIEEFKKYTKKTLDELERKFDSDPTFEQEHKAEFIDKKNMWATEDKVYLRKSYGLIPIEKIADRFGRSVTAVRAMAMKIRVPNKYLRGRVKGKSYGPYKPRKKKHQTEEYDEAGVKEKELQTNAEFQYGKVRGETK